MALFRLESFDIGAVIGHVRQAYALLPHVKVTDLLLEVGSLDEFHRRLYPF
jgi:hypothetical protein